MESGSYLQNNDVFVSDEKAKRLYLKVESVKSSLVTEIIELLKNYKGEIDVVFYDSLDKKYIKSSEIKINIDDNVLNALKLILGEDNVVLK